MSEENDDFDIEIISDQKTPKYRSKNRTIARIDKKKKNGKISYNTTKLIGGGNSNYQYNSIGGGKSFIDDLLIVSINSLFGYSKDKDNTDDDNNTDDYIKISDYKSKTIGKFDKKGKIILKTTIIPKSSPAPTATISPATPSPVHVISAPATTTIGPATTTPRTTTPVPVISAPSPATSSTTTPSITRVNGHVSYTTRHVNSHSSNIRIKKIENNAGGHCFFESIVQAYINEDLEQDEKVHAQNLYDKIFKIIKEYTKNNTDEYIDYKNQLSNKQTIILNNINQSEHIKDINANNDFQWWENYTKELFMLPKINECKRDIIGCDYPYYFFLVYLLRFLFSIHCVNFKKSGNGDSLTVEMIKTNQEAQILFFEGFNIDDFNIQNFGKKEHFDNYRNKIMTSDYYADQYAIKTILNLLEINIIICSYNNEKYEILNNEDFIKDFDKSIFLFHHTRAIEHYELLLYNGKSIFEKRNEINTIMKYYNTHGYK